MPGQHIPVASGPAAAGDALLAGGLVVLPTETVYGLAGNAANPAAVARIYEVKGRPTDHPVIVHVADAASALRIDGGWAREVPDYARALADSLWPGPMTLVLPRSARATDQVTGGQDTVALRVPGHPVARAVIAAMDAAAPGGAPHGVAAPSANRFGGVSPTTLGHALADIGDALDPARDLALDGGPCDVGVESTIIDCTGSTPRILRFGGISAADVERVTGIVPELGGSIRVPGALASHYAPRAVVVIAPDADAAAAYADAAVETGLAPERIALLAPADIPDIDGTSRLAAPRSAEEYAHVLYAAFRGADDRDVEFIIAVPPVKDGMGAAVIDRLRRASAPRPS